MATDLRFRYGPLSGPPYHLVLGGGGDAPDGEDLEFDVDGALPTDLFGFVTLGSLLSVDIDGVLPGLIGDFTVEYQSRASRPVAGSTGVRFQQGVALDVPFAARQQQSVPFPAPTGVHWRDAVGMDVGTTVHEQNAVHLHHPVKSRDRDAVRLHPLPAVVRFQTGLPLDNPIASRDQYALRADGPPVRFRWQESDHTKRNWVGSRYRHAVGLDVPTRSGMQQGVPFIALGGRSRFQNAIRPGPGIWIRPPVLPDPCYLPPLGDAVALRFDAPWTGSTSLLFVCETHGDGPGPEPGDTIVIPVQRVYVVINEASLTRVDGGIPIKNQQFSFSLDADSWTWSFSARVPANQLADLQPGMAGDLVILQAMVNGEAVRVVVEKIVRERAFNSDWLQVSGRGINAALDTPYAPTLNFNVPGGGLTAAQLMEHVLQDNGVPLDWTIDWQLAEDWAVPAGAWSAQGSYMAALSQIAAAGGGYLQPHPVDQIIRVLPRYPALPWAWGAVTPDFSVPAAVAQREGTEWLEKALYNRVFVSGQGQGVLARVTREGSAGDLVAPMVVDALITEGPAGRMRGEAVLADTGKQAMVSLRMPVFEASGLILPGKFVQYHEGALERIGLVRSIGVEVGLPQVWQNLVLETHV